METMHKLSSVFKSSLTENEIRLLASNFIDLVSELIFNPFYGVSGDKNKIDVSKETGNIVKLLSLDSKETGSDVMLSSERFKIYRLIYSENETEEFMKESGFKLPIQYIVYWSLRHFLIMESLSNNSVADLPKELFLSTNQYNELSNMKLTEQIINNVLDNRTCGLQLWMFFLNNTIDRIIYILNTMDKTVSKNLIRLAVNDKESGLSVRELFAYANKKTLYKSVKFLIDQDDSFTDGRIPDILVDYPENLPVRVYSSLNYLTGLKLLCKLRQW